jgi:hypothetical protein
VLYKYFSTYVSDRLFLIALLLWTLLYVWSDAAKIGDGIFFFISLLESNKVVAPQPQRIFANTLQQALVLLAFKGGISSYNILSLLFNLGLVVWLTASFFAAKYLADAQKYLLQGFIISAAYLIAISQKLFISETIIAFCLYAPLFIAALANKTNIWKKS